MDMNELNKSIGPTQNDLKSFLGTMARNSELTSLDCIDWRLIPNDKKMTIFELVYKLISDIRSIYIFNLGKKIGLIFSFKYSCKINLILT